MGCLVPDKKQETVEVNYCPKCRDAEKRWKQERDNQEVN